MKKLLAFALILIMAISFTACTDDDDDDDMKGSLPDIETY